MFYDAFESRNDFVRTNSSDNVFKDCVIDDYGEKKCKERKDSCFSGFLGNTED